MAGSGSGPVRDVNLYDIPLYALRSASRSYLASLLNCAKVLPSPSGLPRDWRGLAHLSGILTGNSKDNPTMYILSAWEKDASASLGQLHEFFGEMDRWDVQSDMEEILYEDAKDYFRRMKNENDTEHTTLKNGDFDKLILTVDDVFKLENGGRLQYYDAFLLFADEDVAFAMEMVNKLENEYGLKLCYKDRDLIGGLTFEHEAIMKLIAERCQRLVIVVTSSFLNSPANKFFVMFAQALGIEQRQRKVIPCIYERCSLPVELSYYFLLDYNRASKLWNFWDKLRNSICAPNVNALPSTRPIIEEVPSSEVSSKIMDTPPSYISTQLKDTKKLKPLENPPLSSFEKSWKTSNSTLNEEDATVKRFSEINIPKEKVKPKRFLEKIGWKKGNVKKTAILDQ